MLLHKFSVVINMGIYKNMVHDATHMLSKDAFVKATFNKINIWKKSSWDIDEIDTMSKSRPAYWFWKSQEKNLTTNVCDFQKESLDFGKVIHGL